jgi:Leucine-rich repeat (LRR) protein
VNIQKLPSLAKIPYSTCKVSVTHLYYFSWITGGNNITGTLPAEISQLSELRILSIYLNSLSGTLPPEYSSLDHLTGLLLMENSLTGSFPDSYRNLGELKTLGLGSNKFTGTIPENYQDMMAIEAFYVKENQLTGSIPLTFFTELNQIVFFDVSLNLLEGNLPIFSSKNSRLDEFRCSNNKFYGKIPEMNFLTDLRTLDLSWNRFNGTMPGNSNKDLIDLKYLRINNNEFSGTIAANNSNHRGLLELNCANNSFTSLSGLGEEIFDLEALDLSSNHLSGTIAEGYGEFSKLTALNLASNLLSGTIPQTFEGLRHSLKYLSLHNTNITDGLEDIFCASNNSSSALITNIKADCLGDDPQIPCDCCATCCNKGGDYCETNATKICQVNAAQLESVMARGANCNCSQDGSRVDCVDTACKSCNIQETSCAINKYGRTFNTATGFILNFYNNITYLTGEWTGIEIQYEANEASTTLDGDYDACSVSINGEACLTCSFSKCPGNNYGYVVDCSNLADGYQYDACKSKYTNPGYLEIFDTYFESKVAGCRLLIPLIGDYKPT